MMTSLPNNFMAFYFLFILIFISLNLWYEVLINIIKSYSVFETIFYYLSFFQNLVCVFGNQSVPT